MDSCTRHFSKPLRNLLTCAEDWRKWALHTLQTPRTYVSGRVALLGDAAHPVLPFLAQGGVLALEDAAVLAGALAQSRDDVCAGLRAYDAHRRGRARRIARTSRMNGHIYHLRGLAAAARNVAIAKLPPERVMARYDWLYGWTPPA
jgi:salicylate hydroxylase